MVVVDDHPLVQRCYLWYSGAVDDPDSSYFLAAVRKGEEVVVESVKFSTD